MRSARRPVRGLLPALVFACALAGCGGGFSGSYEEESGLGRLEFQDDGTVYLSLLGVTVAGEYELDGEHVIVKGPNGEQVLRRNGERLEGAPGLTYVKR
jgi:hypothetical protein